jgi:hypothetical protein
MGITVHGNNKPKLAAEQSRQQRAPQQTLAEEDFHKSPRALNAADRFVVAKCFSPLCLDRKDRRRSIAYHGSRTAPHWLDQFWAKGCFISTSAACPSALRTIWFNGTLAVGDSIYLWSFARTRLRRRITRSRPPTKRHPARASFLQHRRRTRATSLHWPRHGGNSPGGSRGQKTHSIECAIRVQMVRSDFGLRHRRRRDVLGHPTHRRHLVGCDLAKTL